MNFLVASFFMVLIQALNQNSLFLPQCGHTGAHSPLYSGLRSFPRLSFLNNAPELVLSKSLLMLFSY